MPPTVLTAQESQIGDLYAAQQSRGFRWLRFAKPLEGEYIASMRAAKRCGTMICVATALAIWIAFTALDLYRLDVAAEFAGRRYETWLSLGMRWATLAMLVAQLCALLQGRLKSSYPAWSMAGLVMIGTTAAINVCVYQIRGLPRADLAGFAIIMAVFLPLGMTMRQSVVTALMVAASTATVGIALLGPAHYGETLSFSVQLLLAACVGAVGAYLREYAERDQFLLRRRLQYGAMSDALTGIGNRRHFAQQATAALRQAVREGDDVVLAVLDVDHFKRFNDRHGHLAGDMALRQVAQSLKSGLRRPLDLVGRLGGEEFGLLLYGAGAKEAQGLLNGLRATIADLAIAHGGPEGDVHLTVSIGAALLDPAESLDSLYRRADDALYAGKAAGRNRLVFAGMPASLVANAANDHAPAPSQWRS